MMVVLVGGQASVSIVQTAVQKKLMINHYHHKYLTKPTVHLSQSAVLADSSTEPTDVGRGGGGGAHTRAIRISLILSGSNFNLPPSRSLTLDRRLALNQRPNGSTSAGALLVSCFNGDCGDRANKQTRAARIYLSTAKSSCSYRLQLAEPANY
jgi:hypothetical protein